jgi:hypothetical protein
MSGETTDTLEMIGILLSQPGKECCTLLSARALLLTMAGFHPSHSPLLCHRVKGLRKPEGLCDVSPTHLI